MFDIDLIAGARPNFVKIASIIHALNDWNRQQGKKITFRLIHTGQHYDKNMSDVFFEELNIPKPDINLNAGSRSQAEQTAQMMVSYDSLLLKEKAKICLVVGDVTSTLACSIVAKKQHMMLVHVEAGLRSNDRTMPEEINRLVTDSITDIYFTTTINASNILLSEGISNDKIYMVGNTMIDTLVANLDKLRKPTIINDDLIKENNFILLTLHRPSNVDNEDKLVKILDTIANGTANLPLLFPVHPRTKKVLEMCGYQNGRYILIPPLSYLEFMFLVKKSKAIITDSGGVTEEATYLGKPCITLRNSTERPETVEIGTNILVGDDLEDLKKHLVELLVGKWKKGIIPEFWDGSTANRIVNILTQKLNLIY